MQIVFVLIAYFAFTVLPYACIFCIIFIILFVRCFILGTSAWLNRFFLNLERYSRVSRVTCWWCQVNAWGCKNEKKMFFFGRTCLPKYFLYFTLFNFLLHLTRQGSHFVCLQHNTGELCLMSIKIIIKHYHIIWFIRLHLFSLQPNAKRYSRMHIFYSLTFKLMYTRTMVSSLTIFSYFRCDHVEGCICDSLFPNCTKGTMVSFLNWCKYNYDSKFTK